MDSRHSSASATSRPYLGHAVGEHVVSASYNLSARYRGPAARRSNHDHELAPYIWTGYDHSHMRRLVGSEACLRSEVPPRHDGFKSRSRPLRAIYPRCAIVGESVKSTATEAGDTTKAPASEIGGSSGKLGPPTQLKFYQFAAAPCSKIGDLCRKPCYCNGVCFGAALAKCSRGE